MVVLPRRALQISHAIRVVAVQMWEKARALLESCPAARAIGEPCAAAEEAEAVWRVLAELLEPTHVDVGFNLALSLERFDQYYDATLVWEAVIMANPDAQNKASQECSKVLSLIAREMVRLNSISLLQCCVSSCL